MLPKEIYIFLVMLQKKHEKIKSGRRYDFDRVYFCLNSLTNGPRLHKQIKPPIIAQILDPYEVTPDEFAQIK